MSLISRIRESTAAKPFVVFVMGVVGIGSATVAGTAVGPKVGAAARSGLETAYERSEEIAANWYATAAGRTIQSMPGSQSNVLMLQGPLEKTMGRTLFTTDGIDGTPSATSVHVIDVTTGVRVSKQTTDRSGKQWAVVDTLVEDLPYQVISCDRSGEVVGASMPMRAKPIPMSDGKKELTETGMPFLADPNSIPHLVRFNEQGSPFTLDGNWKRQTVDNNLFCR